MKKILVDNGNWKHYFQNPKINIMSYLVNGELLKYILETHCHVEYFTDDWESVKRFLNHPNFPDRNNQFKKQLADAITNSLISPADLEKLTAEEFETQEEVDKFLTNEIWQPLYGNELVKV